jgi:uncharacterized membrane protein YhdT
LEERISIIKLLGLPETFAVVLLTFCLILLLAPYFSGADFGLFKIPQFTDFAKKKLKIIGPIVFAVLVILFVPVITQHVSTSSNNTNRSNNDNNNARIEMVASPSPPVDVHAQAQQHIKRAHDLDNNADFEDAVKECDKALDLEPENQEALELKERNIHFLNTLNSNL